MSRKLTTDEFIFRATKVHGDRYDYSDVVYINNKTKACIVCPIHGKFFQIPNSHLIGIGCPKCSRKYSPNTQEFISAAIKTHGNKYDYSKSNYVNNRKKIIIICKKHGRFRQIPKLHLKGHGCSKCQYEFIASLLKSNWKIFVKKARKAHGRKYNYTVSVYKNSRTKMLIVCKDHGKFYQTPHDHLSGNGCPECVNIVSKPEVDFLNYCGILRRNRQKYISPYRVDGYDPNTNTIYEFLGNYYHGNPRVFNKEDYNQTCHKTYGELYKKTKDKFQKLTKRGYKLKFVWESEWNNFKSGRSVCPQITEYGIISGRKV